MYAANGWVVYHYYARIFYPNGSISNWQEGQTGGWWVNQAGTYQIEGKADAASIFYPNFVQVLHRDPFSFYMVDNYAPAAPQNLGVRSGPNNHPQLTWTANTEADLGYYEIARKVHETGDIWYTIGTTTSTSFVDGDYIYAPGGNFGLTYKIRARDINNNYSSYSSEVTARGEDINKKSTLASIPFDNVLYQNYPNPFNPTTKISYSIEESGIVNMKVYDVLGNEVAELVNQEEEAGIHSVNFDASNLSSGIYIYTIRFKNIFDSKRMILVK